MPNWCFNELTITGKKDVLVLFKKLAKSPNKKEDRVLCFNQFVPYPPLYSLSKDIISGKENFKDGFNAYGFDEKQFLSGYNWCISNWGTKWNSANSEILTETEKSIKYRFDTAWSPPEAWLLKASRLFPSLLFVLRSWEGGVGFKFVQKVRNGEVLFSEESDYCGSRGG